MNPLQTPKHNAARLVLRVLGPVIALVGLVFLLIAGISFFSSMNSYEPPRLFWCGFVGMPLLFVGTVMTMLGFLGALARYTVAEQAPVAVDAANFVADGTQDAVKTVARAAAQGVAEGIQSAQRKDTGPK